ncbi:ATP-binding cassette domain-containing protein [Mycoplasmopsis ciconiae]|uniref:ATP-binding cassette domain-containing protein n=1 Tax=Mycoplasmopsis ciconiae TaxID=561067 RepID=A0ABU7MKV4_9BACT|nr:ATP-binding cassette domain-containing protein [Mycoplasmopsis ciconiae]
MKFKSDNQVLKSNGLPKYVLKEYERLELEHKNKDKNKDDYVLEIKNLDKVYENGFQAVFGTDITLKKGEFLSLLGPSGCGKTTTLRAIAGLDLPTSGSVKINGTDVTYSEPSDRDITMVFQNYALFPHLSVRENIAFGLKANTSKIGEEGPYFRKEKLLLNKLNNALRLVNDIKRIKKLESNADKLKKQIEKFKEKSKNNSSKNQNKKRIEFFKFNAKSVLYNSLLEKIDYVKSQASNLDKINQEIQQLKKQIAENKVLKKEASTKDDKKKVIAQKVQEASDILGLNYYLDRKPSALSGGQRQRVALGRSIVGSPTLFLMDEPLSNLDAKLRASMRSEIRRIHERVNAGTVYVTHDQIEAMTMSDKIAIMSDGFVQQIGSPADVYKNPANIFVAQFIGSPTMNLYEGVFREGKFVCDAFELELLVDKTKNIEENQKIILGIRAQDISVDEIVKDTYQNSFKVQIISKELLGNEIQYVAKFLNSNVQVSFITNSYTNFENDSIQEISFMASRIHIFDQHTTISLTSEFNYETLKSLKNWSESSDKIEIRRELLEFTKNKNDNIGIGKYTLIQINKLISKFKKPKKNS